MEAAGRSWSGNLITTRGDGWEVKVWQADDGYFDRMIKSSSGGYAPVLTAFGDDAPPLLKYATPLTVSSPAAAPPSLSLRNFRVDKFSPGDDGKGTRLLLRFALEDAQGTRVGAISSGQVTATESGQLVPGAGVKPAPEDERPCPVVVLIGPGGPPEIKADLREFVERLREAGCPVRLFQCAETLRPLATVDELPEAWTGDAILTCLTDALEQSPQATVVLFAAGADGQDPLKVEQAIRANGRIVHAVVYGESAADSWRQTFARLTIHGSYAFADSPAGLKPAFGAIAERVSATQTFSYVTPADKGVLRLQLQVKVGLTTATSPVLLVDLDKQSATPADNAPGTQPGSE
jgi:hypothetical protein